MKRRSDRKYRIEDFLGKRFGSRVVIGQGPKWTNGSTSQRWLMRCDCGNETPAEAKGLFEGRALSCLDCAKIKQRGTNSHAWRGGKHLPITLFHKWKRSARRRNIAWCLTLPFLDRLIEKQHWSCAITGDRLIFDFGQRNGVENGNASLDRRILSRLASQSRKRRPIHTDTRCRALIFEPTRRNHEASKTIRPLRLSSQRPEFPGLR
jgi:hypothetical protein